MSIEVRLTPPSPGENMDINQLYNRELGLNEKSVGNFKRASAHELSPRDRANAWSGLLDNVTDKYRIQLMVNQKLRPVLYNEPLIDKSYYLDDRVLESFSPPLLEAVKLGEANPLAAYGIMEYYLRSGYHDLSQEQALQIARLFPIRHADMDFDQYKLMVEHNNAPVQIHGKSPAESWQIKREVVDILEVSELIRQKYLRGHEGNKTIFITDLIKAAGESLYTAHQIGTDQGRADVVQKDKESIFTNQIREFRTTHQELAFKFGTDFNILLSMISGKGTRNLSADLDKLFKLSEHVIVEGLEHVPKEGPAIIAFSHMNSWKDKEAPANWEIAKLMADLKTKRGNEPINVVAYLSFFRDTGSKYFKKLYSSLIDKIAIRAREVYGINFIDIEDAGPRAHQFTSQALDTLRKNQLLLISPEGVPSQEVVRPKRGIGMIARMSGSPVVGVAFREDIKPDGTFIHKMIFTPPISYDGNKPGSKADNDQTFADHIMRTIAEKLPYEQRGIFAKDLPPHQEIRPTISEQTILEKRRLQAKKAIVKYAGIGITVALSAFGILSR